MHRFSRALFAICILLVSHRACRADAPAAPPGSDPAPVVDADTDKIIHSALRYLASRQSPAGSWSANNNFQAAITGYCLVAFMSAGDFF